MGKLEWAKRHGNALFAYDPMFMEKGYDLFPLEMSIHNPDSRFVKIGDTEGLPCFIADFLPDNWGNTLFETWAEAKHLKPEELTSIEKLSYIGKRGGGAFEYFPEEYIPVDKDALRLNEIIELANKIFRDREQLTVLPNESVTLQQLFELGSSVGGRHPKALIAINRKTDEIKSGQIMHGPDYDYYIMKVDNHPAIPFNRIEMAYYQMAANAGLEMMPSFLKKVEEKYCFTTKRFDRKDGRKIHTQSLAAIRPSVSSYEELLKTCRLLNLPAKDHETVFTQATFNVFSANTDDHTKNFKFVLEQGGTWRLSPPFDITYIIHEMTESARGPHCLSINNKHDDINRKDLESLGRENSISNFNAIIDKTCKAITGFRNVAKENAVPRYWIDRIEKHLHALLPDEFKEQMTSWRIENKPRVIQGARVENISFEINSNGAIVLSAIIDGQNIKHVFNSKSQYNQAIIEIGGNNMPDADKDTFINDFLFSKMLSRECNYDSAKINELKLLSAYGIPFGNLRTLAKGTPILFKGSIKSSMGDEKPSRPVNIKLDWLIDRIQIRNPYNNRIEGPAAVLLQKPTNLDFVREPESPDDNVDLNQTVENIISPKHPSMCTSDNASEKKENSRRH